MPAACTLRCRLIRALRRSHLTFGLVGAVYFTLLGLTGVALNHREGFHLERHFVSRTWLPSSYRVDDGAEVRADIVVGDLHSGLIFGRAGVPVMDVVAGLWLLSLMSGLSLAIMTRGQRRTDNGKAVLPFPAAEREGSGHTEVVATASVMASTARSSSSH